MLYRKLLNTFYFVSINNKQVVFRKGEGVAFETGFLGVGLISLISS